MNREDQKGGTDAPVQPVHEIRIGLVKAAVWQNESADGAKVWYKATFSKLYFDDAQSEWRSVKNFDMTDLLVLAEVARQAALWIAFR